MDRNKCNVGMKVAVNSVPDGQVYTVKSINGFNAELVYGPDDSISGGIIDVSVLRKPTAEQLRNAESD